MTTQAGRAHVVMLNDMVMAVVSEPHDTPESHAEAIRIMGDLAIGYFAENRGAFKGMAYFEPFKGPYWRSGWRTAAAAAGTSSRSPCSELTMPPVKIKEPGKKLAPRVVLEKTIIPIVLRRSIETGKPELFFMNGDTRGRSWLMGYAHNGQHFEPSWEYYRTQTVSADRDDADVAALIREWGNQPPLEAYEVYSGFQPFGRKLT